MYTDTYYDRGYEMVEGARIKSWRAGGHGLQTFLQVLENSSNPGFVEIGRRLGLDRLYQYVTDFGFGSKTGIELPGESTGIMFKKGSDGAGGTGNSGIRSGIISYTDSAGESFQRGGKRRYAV